MTLNAEIARELLNYDPETGALTWRPRDRRWFKTEQAYKTWNTRYAGSPAGVYLTRPDGYRRHHIKVLGRSYCVGPVIWLYMTGDWPRGEVDHTDRDPWNQRWRNLRDVTAAENSRNKSAQAREKGCGYPGVNFHRQAGAWHARVGHNGKQVHLGLHDTLLDAVSARKRAERELGFSPGHGQPRPDRSISNG